MISLTRTGVMPCDIPVREDGQPVLTYDVIHPEIQATVLVP